MQVSLSVPEPRRVGPVDSFYAMQGWESGTAGMVVLLRTSQVLDGCGVRNLRHENHISDYSLV